jgi:hypothetical protein
MKTPANDPFQSLQHLEVKPSPEVWKSVEQTLPAPKRTAAAWWWAAALIPLAAVWWWPTPVKPVVEVPSVTQAPASAPAVATEPLAEVQPLAATPVATPVPKSPSVATTPAEVLELAWQSAEPVDMEAEEATPPAGPVASRSSVSFKVSMRPKVQESNTTVDPESGLAHQTLVVATRELGGWVSMAEEEAVKIGRDLTGLIRGNPDTQSNQSP